MFRIIHIIYIFRRDVYKCSDTFTHHCTSFPIIKDIRRNCLLRSLSKTCLFPPVGINNPSYDKVLITMRHAGHVGFASFSSNICGGSFLNGFPRKWDAPTVWWKCHLHFILRPFTVSGHTVPGACWSHRFYSWTRQRLKNPPNSSRISVENAFFRFIAGCFKNFVFEVTNESARKEKEI